MSADLAIKVENLTKRYGHLIAVNDVSFDVKRGEIFAFLGPNGAGDFEYCNYLCYGRSIYRGRLIDNQVGKRLKQS